MKRIDNEFQKMLEIVPKEVLTEVDYSFAIANEINMLMTEHGMTKKQFADALGKKPSEITKWLSGQYNFTLRTIATISTFFGKSLISIS